MKIGRFLLCALLVIVLACVFTYVFSLLLPAISERQAEDPPSQSGAASAAYEPSALITKPLRWAGMRLNQVMTDWIDQKVESGELVRNKDGSLSLPSWIDPEKPMLAITFDDGPAGSLTETILDHAKDKQMHFTFFVLGTRVRRNQELVVRMAEEGHEIGSHGYDHQNKLTKLSAETMAQQLEWTAAVVEEYTGQRPTLLRPPSGAINDETAARVDVPIIMWSVDTADWKYRDADRLEQYILDHAKDGAIILMHDIHKTTVEGAMRAVDRLVEAGYQLVTVSEMFEYRGIALEPGQIYYKAQGV